RIGVRRRSLRGGTSAEHPTASGDHFGPRWRLRRRSRIVLGEARSTPPHRAARVRPSVWEMKNQPHALAWGYLCLNDHAPTLARGAGLIPLLDGARRAGFPDRARKDRKNLRGEREFFPEFADDSADPTCAECGDVARKLGRFPEIIRMEVPSGQPKHADSLCQ